MRTEILLSADELNLWLKIILELKKKYYLTFTDTFSTLASKTLKLTDKSEV